ncbi:Uncharacterized protein TCM_029405 [Theobroma cacao]|uniref:Uncharacterized protein n=1 Tax=Theobroma cacao TaxID=3641 RepID=A0A061GEK9_THECC|nr:Uncharacterized protein TCM_029405 [Theobroma cacao]
MFHSVALSLSPTNILNSYITAQVGGPHSPSGPPRSTLRPALLIKENTSNRPTLPCLPPTTVKIYIPSTLSAAPTSRHVSYVEMKSVSHFFLPRVFSKLVKKAISTRQE